MSPAKPPFKTALGPLAAALAASLAGTILLAPRASAADLDPMYAASPQIQQQQMVTFGSGWYVRGDIGGGDYPGVGSNTPALGLAPVFDFLSGKKMLGYTGSLGGGYAFTNSIRLDAVFDYHQPLHSTSGGASVPCPNGYDETANKVQTGVDPTTGAAIYTIVETAEQTNGTCTPTYSARLSSYDVLANAYYDITTFYGVTPYVGAGVGLSFGHYSTSATYTQYDNTPYDVTITNPVSGSTYHGDFDRYASGTYYNFAFAAMAGFSYDIYPHLKLDIGYRYLNLGKVLGSQYTIQEGRAGLRYMIDN